MQISRESIPQKASAAVKCSVSIAFALFLPRTTQCSVETTLSTSALNSSPETKYLIFPVSDGKNFTLHGLFFIKPLPVISVSFLSVIVIIGVLPQILLTSVHIF